MQSAIANFGKKIFEKVLKVNGGTVSKGGSYCHPAQMGFGHSQDGGIFAKSHALCSIFFLLLIVLTFAGSNQSDAQKLLFQFV
jgi:hypothetical protein